jgi:hypothetical protein
MKERKNMNLLTIVIILMTLIIGVELVVILRSVFDIKSENGNLKYEMSKLMDTNKKLNEKNKILKRTIKQFCEPEVIPPDIPDGWKVYRHPSMGFETGYPKGCRIETGNIEDSQEPIMSILTNDTNTRVDINIADLNTYRNINDYINKEYDYKLYVKKTMPINNHNYEIYKLSGEKQYHFLLKGREYIFDISSKSEDFLIKIIGTFKFI